MQSNEKKYKGAESEETKKNKKNHSIAKKEFDNRSYIYDVRENSLNIGPPPCCSPLSTIILFWSKDTPLLNVLKLTFKTLPLGVISKFSSKNVDQCWSYNRVTYNFFFANAQSIYYSHFHEANFCERLIYLQYFHYRTTSQVQKKFQNRNSGIDTKRDLLFVDVHVHRVSRKMNDP